MHLLRKQKPDTVILNAALHHGRLRVQVESEFCKHVRRTALSRNRAVAVFRDRYARACRDKSGSCRNIEGDSAVAAGSDHVNDIRSPAVDERGASPEHPRSAGEFGETFPLHPERREKGSRLCAGCFPFGYQRESLFRFPACQVAPC